MTFNEILKKIELTGPEKAGIRQLQTDLKLNQSASNWKTQCFLVGYLHSELEKANFLDQAVLIALGDDIPGRMPYLQEMLTQSIKSQHLYGSAVSGTHSKSARQILTHTAHEIVDDYHSFLRRMSPYLIYVADSTCFGALAAFSYGIGHALQELGYQVIFAEKKDRMASFYESLAGQTYRGIIATQDTAYCHKTTDGRYLHDLVDAPLYWMDYDHPAWFYDLIPDMPAKTVFLTVDRNYAAYIEKYYHRKAVFFPPAAEQISISISNNSHGIELKKCFDSRQTDYDISFVGTLYDNLDADLAMIRDKTPEFYGLAQSLVNKLLADSKKTQEAALAELLSDEAVRRKYFHQSEPLSDEQFAQLMHGWAFIGRDMAHRFRKNIVEKILQSGLQVHVFHDSWEIFAQYKNLHIHPSVDYEATDEIYRRSIFSLNTMTWHKAGFTERIANAQINGALSVTDTTEYIAQNYTDGEDIILYDLSEKSIAELPDRLSSLLKDRDRLDEIAYNGMKKAAANHTWKNRAIELVTKGLKNGN